MDEKLRLVVSDAEGKGWKVEPQVLKSGKSGFVLKNPAGEIVMSGVSPESVWKKSWVTNLLPSSSLGIK